MSVLAGSVAGAVSPPGVWQQQESGKGPRFGNDAAKLRTRPYPLCPLPLESINGAVRTRSAGCWSSWRRTTVVRRQGGIAGHKLAHSSRATEPVMAPAQLSRSRTLLPFAVVPSSAVTSEGGGRGGDECWIHRVECCLAPAVKPPDWRQVHGHVTTTTAAVHRVHNRPVAGQPACHSV